jgi:tetratricopeptide (TPR) repeat protein
MPKAATEVPHVAFTHHRIGIHSPGTTAPPLPSTGTREGDFIAGEELDLPDIEQTRLRGLAHFMQFKKHGGGPAGTHHYRRAVQLLNEALESGAGDAPVRAALAELLLREQPEQASRLAESVVQESQAATREWLQAARVLAEVAFARQEFAHARDLYRQLAEARPDASYWFYLGVCEQNCGDTPAAVRALQKSLEIDPVQTGAHDVLIALHQTERDWAAEAAHRQASAVVRAFLRQLAPSARHEGEPFGFQAD